MLIGMTSEYHSDLTDPYDEHTVILEGRLRDPRTGKEHSFSFEFRSDDVDQWDFPGAELEMPDTADMAAALTSLLYPKAFGVPRSEEPTRVDMDPGTQFTAEWDMMTDPAGSPVRERFTVTPSRGLLTDSGLRPAVEAIRLDTIEDLATPTK